MKPEFAGLLQIKRQGDVLVDDPFAAKAPYVLVDAINFMELEDEVARYILEGYVPVGGIIWFHEQPSQAMVLQDLAGWREANRGA